MRWVVEEGVGIGIGIGMGLRLFHVFHGAFCGRCGRGRRLGRGIRRPGWVVSGGDGGDGGVWFGRLTSSMKSSAMTSITYKRFEGIVPRFLERVILGCGLVWKWTRLLWWSPRG